MNDHGDAFRATGHGTCESILVITTDARALFKSYQGLMMVES